ncbi:matrixin family metalloprotease [Catenuloplanes sp. NPDC020197]|uniref:matrixin family metalloprotease n=1 Tax=Catenuloplanes sp. NPDC020197 TaxID=3363958 RepID=UPI0037AB7205
MNVDGTKVEIFLPAPGVTAERLAASLRAHGRPHTRAIAPGRAAPAGPNDCAYGQARTLYECRYPVSFWQNNGHEDPIVRFNDHSGASWPVSNAVSKWNQVPNIDSWYYWNQCPFMAGARCVDVLSGNYGPGDQDGAWIGKVTFRWTTGAGGPLPEQGTMLQLNDYHDPKTGGFTRNMVTTHEIGHVLGLGHNLYSGDVMAAAAHKREDIGGENATLLANLYSITR